MSTEKATVQTTRMGQVALTQFFGGKEDGRCVQLTCKGSSADGFQVSLQESMNIAYWATDSDRDYHLKNASRELNRLLEIKNILEGGVL